MVFQDNPAGRMLDPRMKKGDKVMSFADVPIAGQVQFIQLIRKRPGQPTSIEVLRGSQRLKITVIPKPDPVKKAGLVALGRRLRLRRRSPLGRSGCALGGGGGRGRALIGGGGLLGRGLRRLLRCRGLLLSRLAGARHREQDDENGRAAGHDLPRLCHGVVHLSPTRHGVG